MDTGEIEHKIFKDIIQYFGRGHVRIQRHEGVSGAATAKRRREQTSWSSCSANSTGSSISDVIDPARKIRIGNKLYFGEDQSLVAEVIDNTTSRGERSVSV